MEFDPWGPIIGLLFQDQSSDYILGVLQRAGINTVFNLNEQEAYSHNTRKRAYKSRLDRIYEQLDEAKRRIVTRNLAFEMSQSEHGLQRLSNALSPIGWEFSNGSLTPSSSSPATESNQREADTTDNSPVSQAIRRGVTKFIIDSRKVFLVHGHNHGSKEAVARLLSKLGLEPIILHEQTDRGRTIIEKFEAHASEVGNAVVLLTADDEGRARHSPNKPNLRARQNVILEFGYFVGKLGRNHTFALVEDGVEFPSDLHGLIYISLKEADWKIRLARELKDAGLAVDPARAT